MEQYYFHDSDQVIEGRTFTGGFAGRAMHPDGRPFGPGACPEGRPGYVTVK